MKNRSLNPAVKHNRALIQSRSVKTAVLLLALFSLTLSLPAQDQPTLAVVPVFSMGVDSTRTKIVYDYIIDQVNRTNTFSLVERAALDKALAEIKFSMKEIIDERTAARIGKISGAKYILIPALYLSENTFHLSLRVIETDTARIKNTSVKTTDSFKNVEALTAEAIRALLDIETATAATAAPGSKKLWGNYYFVDDRDASGSSTIDDGIGNDGKKILALRGTIVPFYKGAYLLAGLDFNEASIALMKKTKGIRMKITGDNQYFVIGVKTSSVKNFDWFSRVVFLPSRETELDISFAELSQVGWGKPAVFHRDDVTGIQFMTFSHRFNLGKVELQVRDITAITDEERLNLPERRTLKGVGFFYDDSVYKGTSTVSINLFEHGFMGLEGRVTNVHPNGFLGMTMRFDAIYKKFLTRAKGFAFRLAGDGKEYLCRIITSPVKDYGYHQTRVKAESAFTSVDVFFKDLKQPEYAAPVSFDRSQILGIEFLTIGQPLASIQIKVAEIEYIPE